MTDLREKDYVVIVQCDLVKQRCSGYFCEKAFTERTGGFSDYPKDKAFRRFTRKPTSGFGKPRRRETRMHS